MDAEARPLPDIEKRKGKRLMREERQALNAALAQFPQAQFARHDAMHCLMPGLFRSLDKKQMGKPNGFDLRHQFGDIAIAFRGPYLLGTFDLRLLQVIVAMAGISNTVVSKESDAPKWIGLRRELLLKHQAADRESLIAVSSWREIAAALGTPWSGKNIIERMRQSLDRLWGVTVIVEKSGHRAGFQILSFMEDDDDYVVAAVNPQITAAIFGQQRHVRIDLNEVRALKSDGAILIHQRLCAWVNPGETRRVDLDTLVSYVYASEDGADTSDAARRQRRSRTQKFAQELKGIGWTIAETGREKFTIGRPAPPKELFD